VQGSKAVEGCCHSGHLRLSSIVLVSDQGTAASSHTFLNLDAIVLKTHVYASDDRNA